MRRALRRWLLGAGVVAAVGALAGGTGLASASPFITGPVGSQKAPPPYVPPSHDLYYGDTGAAVKSVEERLNELHYYAGPDDGNFGPDLEWAVWAFKEAQGLPMNQMNADLYGPNSTITWAFRQALIHPRQPKVLVPNGGAERVEINLSDQLLVLYKHDVPYLILHISSAGGYEFCDPPPPKGDGACGRAVTPDGNFHAVYFIPGLDIVPLGQMYNPVFFDPAAGDAMHGGDPDPWYPASHGCVRLPLDVENWYHSELTVGGPHATPVYIRGIAPYEPSFF
jgi:peptidoglycan hydrolase-like protein with peptidoglycan-binding domain